MKKFFAVLGVVFVVLIVLGGVGFAIFAVHGTAADKESKAYADAAIPAIVGAWNDDEVFKRASPEFKKVVTQVQLYQLFHRFAGLGHLQKCEPARGQSITTVTWQNGIQTKAEYSANATFDKGPALVDVALIKHGDQWQILGFFVKSPALPLH